jgi:hypothetical protein
VGERGSAGPQTVSAPAIFPADAFEAPAADIFGRRVDIPKVPSGQSLPQDASQQKKASDPDWLTAAPAGTQGLGGWQRVYGVSVPFSTSDGPSRMEDGLALGYSRTPQGAALAMMQIYYRTFARPADDKIRDRQMVLTPEDKVTVAQRKAEGKLPEQLPESATKYIVATDAFRILSFSPDAALVGVAGRGPASTWLAQQAQMVWVNGDWRLKGDAANRKQETITSLGGWTRW